MSDIIDADVLAVGALWAGFLGACVVLVRETFSFSRERPHLVLGRLVGASLKPDEVPDPMAICLPGLRAPAVAKEIVRLRWLSDLVACRAALWRDQVGIVILHGRLETLSVISGDIAEITATIACLRSASLMVCGDQRSVYSDDEVQRFAARTFDRLLSDLSALKTEVENAVSRSE